MRILNTTWLKSCIWILASYPLVRWGVLIYQEALGANPTEFLIRSSGIWCLVALLVCLSIRPLQIIFKRPELIQLRRLCGLWAFFYATLHLIMWYWWERGLSLSYALQDIIDRPFITVGVGVWIVMLVLALTSNRWSMRRLGRHWQRLHYSVYAVAAFSLLHFFLIRQGKTLYLEPIIYSAVFLVLMLIRVHRWYKRS